MKKPVTVKSFQELSYVLKSGHAPMVREPHRGNWQIEYNGRVIEADMPYPVCVDKIKVYKRMGNVWPKPELIKIKPFKG